ncbi:MAG: hypothetical protein HY063_13250 [Bacteroidetes bacterium]|nr:hypothetical protein [Bacteroidota bacterium]
MKKFFYPKSLKGLSHFLTFSLSFFILLSEQCGHLLAQNLLPSEPRIFLEGGIANSCIDLSRYTGSGITNTYRGLHFALDAKIKRTVSISAEASLFPVHRVFLKWEDAHTRKYDLNLHFYFFTASSTKLFFLAGINRHLWNALYAGTPDPLNNLFSGTNVEVKSWGMNCGMGFVSPLYDNLALNGDFRFSISDARKWEAPNVMDVLLTFGISYFIRELPLPDKKHKVKTSHTGKKVYKWTEKGAK